MFLQLHVNHVQVVIVADAVAKVVAQLRAAEEAFLHEINEILKIVSNANYIKIGQYVKIQKGAKLIPIWLLFYLFFKQFHLNLIMRRIKKMILFDFVVRKNIRFSF